MACAGWQVELPDGSPDETPFDDQQAPPAGSRVSAVSKHSFWHELRRRHVYRVAAAYAVGSWLITEITSQVFPVFGIPDWTVRLLIVLLLSGFPLALVLAWALEVTPTGIRRTEPLDSIDARAPEDAQKIRRQLNGLIISLLLLTLAILVVRQFVLPSLTEPTPAAYTDEVLARSIVGSVAVLPFENLSTDDDNAYFADGIRDEVLSSLSRIGQIKVLSPVSTSQYPSDPENIGEIARQLGVTNILSGRVQKSGSTVRISVQLSGPASDDTVWAETYDRNLGDVFAVQSEVAQHIAEALHASLSSAEQRAIERAPTANGNAYAAYLKARALMARSAFERDNIKAVIDALEQAVSLDPEFALAWAALAEQHVWMYWEGFDPSKARLDEASSALGRARQLAPAQPEVELAEGIFDYYGKRDFQAALEKLERARAGMPNNAWAWHASALVQRRLGRWQAALKDFERARELNPNDLSLITNHAITLAASRDFERALSSAELGLAINADNATLLAFRLFCLRNLGRVSQADRLVEQLPAGRLTGAAARAYRDFYQRRFETAGELFSSAIDLAGDRHMAASFSGYIPVALDLRLHQASSEARSGQHQAALVSFGEVATRARAALARASGSANVGAALHAALAMALAGQGQADEAVTEARRAVALVPATADAAEGPVWLEYLARVYVQNGQLDEAEAIVRELLERSWLHPLTLAFVEIDPAWDRIAERFAGPAEPDIR